jgi:carboxyl-terminal processing protease
MKKILLLTLLLSLFGQSLYAQDQPLPPGAQLTLDDLRTFTDVFNQLRTNFVEPVDDRTLLNAAINGMLTELDPYSSFLDTDASQELEDSSQGRYTGIGVQLGLRDGRIIVTELMPGGPAEQAGVKLGDLITAVDGVPVRDRKIFESFQALSGEPGSAVRVSFKRGKRRARELELVREFVQIITVRKSLLDGGIGYFEIAHFNRNTPEELENGIRELGESLGAPLRGIILDLRDNPGGVMRSAVEIADGFLDQGLIMNTRGRYEAARLEFSARPGQWSESAAVVLLVNGASASASEVLTGALKDHGRALVIGQKTFGKGSIQSIFNLRNGSALKLTTAHYFTPGGHNIHGNGIEPDIEMDLSYEGLVFVEEAKDDRLVIEAVRHILGEPPGG